jgi:hypothetical protein
MTPRAATDAATRDAIPCAAQMHSSTAHQAMLLARARITHDARDPHPRVGVVGISAATTAAEATCATAQQRRRVREVRHHVRGVIDRILIDEVQHVLCDAQKR